MPFNIMNPRDQDRLIKAIQASNQDRDPYLSFRRKLINAYVGQGFGPNMDLTKPQRRQVNPWAMAVDSTVGALSGGLPQLNLVTEKVHLKPFAADFQEAVNVELRLMQMDAITSDWVKEACFGIGCLKLGYAKEGYLELLPGAPQERVTMFCEPVFLEDLILDFRAKRFDQMAFAGNTYRAQLDYVREEPSFDREARHNAEEWSERLTGPRGEPQAQGLGSYMDQSADIKPLTELVDVFLYEEQLLCTFTHHKEQMRLLRVVEWNGPQRGCYHFLGLGTIPSNVFPKGIGNDLFDLHCAIVGACRKVVGQTERLKKLGFFNAAEGDAAKQIRDASDGEMLPIEDPKSVVEVTFGGPDSVLVATYQLLESVFSRQAGNLDAALGLGPQSETASQDAIILQTVQGQLNRMAKRVQTAVTELCKDIGWYLWRDDRRQFEGFRAIAGTDRSYEYLIAPGDREGDWLDYGFTIDPYSIRYRTPRERSQVLLALWDRMILPLAPMLPELGLELDAAKVFETVADYENLPELKEILKITSPRDTQDVSPRQSANTTRTYERVSRGPSRQSQANMAVSQMQNQDDGG